MELILIVLTSTLISGLLVSAFYLGYQFREKKGETEGVHLNKNNAEFLSEMAKWSNYNGK